jgi:hypothetical protein
MGCPLVFKPHLLLIFHFLDLILLFLLCQLLLEIVFFHLLDLLLGVVHILYDLVSCAEAKICDIDCASTRRSLKQQLLKLVVLTLQLTDEFVRGALVHNGLVNNLLRSVSVSQRRE